MEPSTEALLGGSVAGGIRCAAQLQSHKIEFEVSESKPNPLEAALRQQHSRTDRTTFWLSEKRKVN